MLWEAVTIVYHIGCKLERVVSVGRMTKNCKESTMEYKRLCTSMYRSTVAFTHNIYTVYIYIKILFTVQCICVRFYYLFKLRPGEEINTVNTDDSKRPS